MAYIGAEPVPGQNREVDDISSSFNGNATAFTLQVSSVNVSPESANNILINLGGVLQNPGTDYTIAASTITFTTAPAAGLSFFGLILGAGINTATVADDTIGASKLIDTAVTAGSYTTADITVDAQGRITAAASGSISNAEIANNAVTTAKIADSTGASDGVTTAKLATDAVTAAKLASNSVVSDSIVDGSIVNADINASAAIAVSKLATFVNTNADNRVITGSATTNTLNGESTLTWNGTLLDLTGTGSEINLRGPGTTTHEIVAIGSGNNNWEFINNSGAGNVTSDIIFKGSGSGGGSVSEKLRITDKGVGINHDTSGSSTNAALTIKNRTSSSATRFNLVNSGSTSTESTQIFSQNNDLAFVAGGNERFRVLNGGPITIGETTLHSSDTLFVNIQQPTVAGGHSVHLEGHTTSSINSSNVIKCVLHGFYRQSYGQNGFLFTNGDDTSHNRGVRVHQYRNNDNTVVGSIFFNTSSTDFNTSSDYRLKENEVLISDGITRIKQLKPYRFNFKSMPSETVDGFFAHEVASVVPFAVGGEKDEMKPNAWYQEGDTIPTGKAVGDVKGYSSTEMEIQQLDYSKLVTVTIAALQEAITKIETLETKVAALEAA